MAVASDGQLFAWGDNSHHQLGLDPNNLQWGGRHADDDEEYKFENLDDQEKEDSQSEDSDSEARKKEHRVKKDSDHLRSACVPY